MAIVKTTVVVDATVWVCDFCGRKAEHVDGTAAPLTMTFFIETLRWVRLSESVISCDRCRKQADIANDVFASALMSARRAPATCSAASAPSPLLAPCSS